jgi:hypothetical protein
MLRRSSLFYLVAFLSVPLLVSCDDELTDGVDIADIPAYYFDNNYLDDKAKAINDAIAECTDGCETFFWITDIHWEPNLNARKAPLLIKYIASKTGINKILNGGDTGNSQVICKNAIAQLKNAIGSNAVYSVNGNHEINDASRYERPFRRVADELRGHNTDIVYGDDNQSYFYFDNYENKVRYIGLSTFGLYLNDEYESCYTTEQLDWLNNTALNVQDGWTMIIFTHALYSISGSTNKLIMSPTGAKQIIDVIDKYSGKGTISCVLVGHTHRDRIHIGKSGVPYIISASDRHDSYNGDINVKRTPGTISEQHLEVVVIDKGKKQIKLFSIGANARDGVDDAPGSEVEVRTVNF